MGPKGKVIGIDHIKELVDDSISNVKKDDPSLITSGRVKLIGEQWQVGLCVLALCYMFEQQRLLLTVPDWPCGLITLRSLRSDNLQTF